MLKLHEFAEMRGDGLRPQLRDLFARSEQSATRHLNLAVIHDNRVSGPHPQARLDGEIPGNVVRFRPRSSLR